MNGGLKSKSIKDLIHNTVFNNYKDYDPPEKWFINCKVEMPEFIRWVEERFVTNYDGYGELLYRNRVLKDSKLYLMGGDIDQAHITFNGYKIRLKLLYDIFKNDVAIMWYNK